MNDVLGHAAGDCALRKLAVVLRRETRGIDTVARSAGRSSPSSTRTYREGVESREALEELEAQSGAQFSPELVDAFMSLDGQLQGGFEVSRRDQAQLAHPSERSSSESRPRKSTK